MNRNKNVYNFEFITDTTKVNRYFTIDSVTFNLIEYLKPDLIV